MNGWAVGDTVLHTTNGGNTWSTQFIGTNVQLEAVYCIDSNMVWAVGDSGTILHTTNGGATWTSQTSGTTNLLWGVFFTDADTGTIVGNGGIILRTTNGGVTWTSQNSGTTTTLGGVYFTDANTGTIVGSNGTILHTTNGGATWTSQESGSINQLWCVFFINADTGTVVGGPWPNGSVGGIILHTTNGGTTWTKQNIPTQKAIYRVFFTDANTGTAVGYDGTILCTLTGGEPPVGIENRQDELAWNLSLSQNYPNPFSSKTVISYQLPITGDVELSVYDLIGRKVTTLVKERQQAGSYEVEWDAETVKSGIYFCKLKVAKFEKTVKLIISH
jgi:photosystem II stability/assembly factor-like uncharacterized protein